MNPFRLRRRDVRPTVGGQKLSNRVRPKLRHCGMMDRPRERWSRSWWTRSTMRSIAMRRTRWSGGAANVRWRKDSRVSSTPKTGAVPPPVLCLAGSLATAFLPPWIPPSLSRTGLRLKLAFITPGGRLENATCSFSLPRARTCASTSRSSKGRRFRPWFGRLHDRTLDTAGTGKSVILQACLACMGIRVVMISNQGRGGH